MLSLRSHPCLVHSRRGRFITPKEGGRGRLNLSHQDAGNSPERVRPIVAPCKAKHPTNHQTRSDQGTRKLATDSSRRPTTVRQSAGTMSSRRWVRREATRKPPARPAKRHDTRGSAEWVRCSKQVIVGPGIANEMPCGVGRTRHGFFQEHRM